MKLINTVILLLGLMVMNCNAEEAANHLTKSQVDTLPKISDSSATELSQSFPKATGTVKLKVSLSAEGQIKSIEIYNSTNAKLNKLAKKLISKRKFDPAMESGKPVGADFIVPVVFI
jgi:TonB family protein